MKENYDIKELLYIISHDFNSSLRHIREFSKLLIRSLNTNYSLSDKEKMFANYILEGVADTENMISDLLRISRVNTVQPKIKKVNLNNLVDKKIAELKEKYNEVKTEIIIEFSSQIEIEIDETHLCIVIDELLDNAFKFRSKNKDVLILEMHLDIQDKAALFKISDNGIGGINESFSQNIFTLFQKLHSKDDYAGTGSGLTIAEKIITKYGGKIWLENSNEDGSEFRFLLPIKQI